MNKPPVGPEKKQVGDKDQITDWLHAWKKGDEAALEMVMDYFYHDLEGLAHLLLDREYHDPGMQTVDVVNQMFLSLVNKDEITFNDRDHFFRVAAMAMRRVLITQARKRASQRRGSNMVYATLDEEPCPLQRERTPEQWLLIDEVLQQLAGIDQAAAEMVTLRFFGGYTIEETASVLGLSPATVIRKWQFAKAWLYTRMQER